MSVWKNFVLEPREIEEALNDGAINEKTLDNFGWDGESSIEVDVKASVEGSYRAATHWDPAEYPEVYVTEVLVDGTKAVGVLGDEIIDIIGGQDYVEEEIWEMIE